MNSWSFYSLETGIFADLSMSGTESEAAMNVPAGHALHAGSVDRMRYRMDTATGLLADHQPPKPEDSDMQTWAWDAGAWRWRSTPTLAAVAISVRADRAGRLYACDWVVTRASELSQPVPAEWATYRQALRDVPAQPGFPTVVVWPESPPE